MKFTDNNLSDSLVQKAKEMLEAGGPSIKYDQSGAHVCDSTGKVIRSFKQRDNGSKFKKDAQNFLTSKMRELNAAYEPGLNESAVASIPKSDWEKAKKSRTKGVIIKGLDGKTHEYSWKKGPDGKPDSRLGKDPKSKKRIKDILSDETIVSEEKGRGPTGIAYSVTPGHPDAENPKTREKYPERQTPEYKAKWKKKSKPGLGQHTGLKNPMKEETLLYIDLSEKEENLDEISKGLASRYIKRAVGDAITKSNDAQYHTSKALDANDKGQKKISKKHQKRGSEASRKTMNRFHGINRAAGKLDPKKSKGEYLGNKNSAKMGNAKKTFDQMQSSKVKATEDEKWPRPFSKSERDEYLQKKKEDYKKSLKDGKDKGKLKEVTSMPSDMPIKTPRIKKFKLNANESEMYDNMKTLAKMRQQKKDAAFHAGLEKIGSKVNKVKDVVKKKLGLSKEEWNQDAEFYLEPLAESWFDTNSWPTHKDHRKRTAHRKFADAANSPDTLKKRQKMSHAGRKAYDAAIKKRLDKEHGVGSKHETTPLPKHLHHPKVKLNNSYDNFGEYALDMIDELSTDMLVRYISKASNAKGHKKLPLKKVDNRYDGVAKAGEILDKRLSGKSMKKEDIQFNEDVKAASKIPYKKEYYQGNYSGAAKAIEKKYGSKVLKNKKVQDALRKANEEMEKEFSDSLLERAVSQIGFMYQDKAKVAKKKDNTKLKAKQKVYSKKQQSVGQKVRPDVIDMQAQTEIQGPMLSEETLEERNTAVKISDKSIKMKMPKDSDFKPIPGNPDYKGPQNPKPKVKLNVSPGNMKKEDVDDKKPYVQEKDGKFCLYDREGNLVKEFDDKAEAEKHMSKMMSESFKHYNVTHKKTGKKYRVTAMHKNSAAQKARAQHGGTASRYTGTSTDDFHIEEYVKEDDDKKPYIQEKDGKFCVYDSEGNVAKEFDDKSEAEKYMSKMMSEGKMVPGFMGADGKPTSKPTKKDYEANKEYQSMKKKGVAPKVKEESVDVKSFYEAAREIMFEKMAKQDHDGDGEVETKRQEWKGSKDKAIKKAMKKEGSPTINDPLQEFKADGEDSEIADPVDVPVDPKKREKETKLLKKKPSKEEIKKALKKEEIELLSVNEDDTIDIMFKHEDKYIVEKNINISEISDKMKVNYIKKANKEITDKEKFANTYGQHPMKGEGEPGAEKKILKRRLGVRQARSKLGQ